MFKMFGTLPQKSIMQTCFALCLQIYKLKLLVDDKKSRALDQATQPTLTGTTSQASNIFVQVFEHVF